MSGVRLTANRSDEEPWRIERLQRVWDRLQAAGVQHLVKLNDSKGTLTCYWEHVDGHRVSKFDDAVKAAWAAEREYEVHHHIVYKVGDRVACAAHGWGTVTKFDGDYTEIAIDGAKTKWTHSSNLRPLDVLEKLADS